MSLRAIAPLFVLGLAVAVGLFLLLGGEDQRSGPGVVVAPRADQRTGGEPASRPELSPLGERSGHPLDAETGDTEFRGRVVDPTGQPLARVAVGVLGSSGRARTRSDGRFVLHNVPENPVIEPGSSEFALVGRTRGNSDRNGGEPWFVFAPAIDVAGVVVDRAGAPIQVEVHAAYPPELFAESLFPGHNAPLTRDATTDLSGHFRLERIPAIAGAQLVVARGGYWIHRSSLPQRSTSELRIEMLLRKIVKARLGKVLIHGIVVDETGEPVRDAKVVFDDTETLTDAEGRFGILGSFVPWDSPLAAAVRGRAPAVLSGYAAKVIRAMQDAAELPAERLVLAAEPGSITGVLVDAREHPLPGWRVGLIGGAVLAPEPGATTVEELASGARHATRTPANGRFRFDGLRPGHRYRVRAWNDEQLLSYTSASLVAAKSSSVREFRFRLPKNAPRPVIRGTLRARDGTPLPDVEVRLSLVTAANGERKAWYDRGSTRTSAAGEFEFESVPRTELWLRCRGKRVVDEDFPLPPEASGAELNLWMARLLRFRFQGGGGTYGPDSITVVDAGGVILPLHRQIDRHGGGRVPLEEGRSPVLFVSEEGRSVVVFRGGDEIDRLPLELVAGEITLVRR